MWALMIIGAIILFLVFGSEIISSLDNSTPGGVQWDAKSRSYSIIDPK